MSFYKPNKLICKCGETVDEFGDHFFICPHHSKISLHNRIRDTIYTIAQNIGAPANFIQEKQSCLKEESRILPSYPLVRPGDITLHPHKRNHNYTTNYKERMIVIDCTILEHLQKSQTSHFTYISHVKLHKPPLTDGI